MSAIRKSVGAVAARALSRLSGFDGVAVGLLFAAALLRLPFLADPFVGQHAFRQSQTAYAALEFHQHGIDLLRPMVPVLGRPFVLVFELPLFQAMASIPMAWGVSLEASVRGCAVLCFVATGALLFALARRLLDRIGARLCLAAFLFSPFSLAWGKAGLIEYLATALSLAAIVAAFRFREGRGARSMVWAATAAVAASLAMAVKITTGVFWLVPLGAVLLLGARGRPAGIVPWLRRVALTGAVIAPALAAGMVWTRWADSRKAAHPLTAVNTSAGLRTFNFGHLGQRFVLANWGHVFGRTVWPLALGGVWILFAVGGIRRARPIGGRQSLVWASMVVAVVLPVAVFLPLYMAHTYYVAAISPGIALFVGAGMRCTADRATAAWRSRQSDAGSVWLRDARFPVVLSTAVLLSSSMLLSPASTMSSIGAANTADPILTTARELAVATHPDELVGAMGFAWDPTLFLYARRRGAMMNASTRQDVAVRSALDEWRSGHYGVVVVSDSLTDFTDLLSGWRWVSSASPHVLRIGDGSGPPAGTAVGTWQTSPVPAGASRIGGVRRLECGPNGIVLRSGRRVRVDLAAGAPPTARLTVGDDVAALPGVRSLFVAASSGRTLRCAGAAAVVVTGIWLLPD